MSDFQPFEYFCFGCGRLYLCCDPMLEGCKSCGAPFTHKGKPGSLDGKKLKDEFRAMCEAARRSGEEMAS